jgi:hypothetical protein
MKRAAFVLQRRLFLQSKKSKESGHKAKAFWHGMRKARSVFVV